MHIDTGIEDLIPQLWDLYFPGEILIGPLQVLELC